ncbi:hypothetical protein [uncultured Pedobacter sp.]|uniref:hypothetical protein n=1 Tax=uncultured Pedobacter sp. TaxID=246139 RepID=UPI0025FE2238|nr:hypothetical protein [uncultured Pedobacter sp.]
MIKKLLVIAFGIVLFSLNLKAQESFDKWPALENFHTVISQTFHPAEEGNLFPVKKRSGELLKKAVLLHKSDIPVEFSRPGIIPAVHKLYLETAALDKLVKGKSGDKLILAQLKQVHDCFHTIVGICSDKKD